MEWPKQLTDDKTHHDIWNLLHPVAPAEHVLCYWFEETYGYKVPTDYEVTRGLAPFGFGLWKWGN